MARGYSKLSVLAIGRAKEPGLYPDGQGLYLQVAPSGRSPGSFATSTPGGAGTWGWAAWPR